MFLAITQKPSEQTQSWGSQQDTPAALLQKHSSVGLEMVQWIGHLIANLSMIPVTQYDSMSPAMSDS